MRFKFGNHITPSLGFMKVRLPCPGASFIQIEIDVVDLDVPMLLGLRELRQNQLLVDYLDKKIINKKIDWKMDLRDKHGHMYWSWDVYDSFFTKREIERLHYHSFHRSSKKLYDLVRKSELGQSTTELQKMIQQVTEAYNECKQYSSKPFRF